MDESELRKFAMGARGEVDFLTCGIDVYDRTALHWTVVYDSPLKTVESIVRVAGDGADVARSVRDNKGDRPFELAIKDGADVDIIRALLPEHLDFETVLQNIVKLVVMPKRKRLNWRDNRDIVGADAKIGADPQKPDVFDNKIPTSASRGTGPPTPKDSSHARFVPPRVVNDAHNHRQDVVEADAAATTRSGFHGRPDVHGTKPQIFHT